MDDPVHLARTGVRLEDSFAVRFEYDDGIVGVFEKAAIVLFGLAEGSLDVLALGHIAGIDHDPIDQWMVQLGSFSAKDNAEKYAAKVKASGFPAMVSSFRSGGKTMYRVQVGPRDDRPSADRLVAQLKKSGHKGLVMPVNP